jgi:hypothetical protein
VGFRGVGFVEPVAALVADLHGGEPGQKEVRGLGGGVDHEHAVQRLVAGEIEEVVVLAEAQPRRALGGAEHDDEALLNRLRELLAARGEFASGIAHSLGMRGRASRAAERTTTGNAAPSHV